jgi:integrase
MELAYGRAVDTTFHDLRHTFASTALAEGVPISEVSRWLGHKSITTTVDLYGHLFADTEDLGRTAVDQVLRPVLTEPERNWSTRDYKAAGQSAGGGRAGL